MKTNTIFTIISTILIIAVIGIMGYVIKTQRDMLNSIEQNNKEQVFLKDNITRIESSLLSSKDFEKRLSGLDMDIGVIKRDLANVGGKIDGIIIAENKTPGGSYIGLPSTGTTPIDNGSQVTDPNCPNCILDPYKYYSNVQQLELSEPLSDNTKVPWGSVEFNATKENPWSYNVKQRTYSTNVVLATDAEGDKRVYTKMSIKVDDKRYDMPEVQTQYVERYPEPRFFLWNPAVTAGVDVGYSTNPNYSVIPSAQVFVSSYGKTKKDSKWRIGGVGAGYDAVTNNYTIMVTPFTYKPTSDGSVLQNTQLGPSVGVDVNGKVYGGVGVKIGL